MKDKFKRFTKKYLNIKYIMPFVLIFSLSFAMLFSANADYVTVTSTADKFSFSAGNPNNTNFYFSSGILSTNLSNITKFFSYESSYSRNYQANIYLYFPRSFPVDSAVGLDFSFWDVSSSTSGTSFFIGNQTSFMVFPGLYSESEDGNEVNFAWGEYFRPTITDSNVVSDAGSNGYPANSSFTTAYNYNSYSLSFDAPSEFNVLRIIFSTNAYLPSSGTFQFLFNQAVIRAIYYDDGAGGDISSDTSSDTDTDTDSDSGGTGGGDTSSGGGGSINWPETDQPEIDNGLNDANSGLHDVENELNSAFDDVYSDVDLDIDNVITDDILSSTYFFSQMLGTCFDGLPWLNTIVTVSLVIGGIGVLLGFFKRSG